MTIEEVIQALTDLGMGRGEAKTYVALVTEGPEAATPLAKRAGVPQPKVYEYLRNLEERDFIMEYESNDRAKRYEAVSYHIVLRKLEEEIGRKIKSSQQYLEKHAQQDREDTQSLVHVKVGKDSVHTKVEDMISKAKHNVLIIGNNYYQEFFQKMMSRYNHLDFRFLSLTEEPSWLASIKMRMVKKVRNKFINEIEDIQPAYMAIDVDYENNTSPAVVVLTPAVEDEEPFITVFKHHLIAHFQIRLITTVLEVLREQNLIDE